MMSKNFKKIIDAFAVSLLFISIFIIRTSIYQNLSYTVSIIFFLFAVNSAVFIIKKSYKIFIIIFLIVLSFSFVLIIKNYFKYESFIFLMNDKKNNNSLERVLLKERFFKVCEKGDIEEIKELIDKVDINVKDAYGMNGMMHALVFDNLEAVKLLIEYGADINSYDYKYRTPLMYAVSNGNADIVKFLISKNAYINAKDYRNKTALDIAKSKGYDDIVIILENAKRNIKK